MRKQLITLLMLLAGLIPDTWSQEFHVTWDDAPVKPKDSEIIASKPEIPDTIKLQAMDNDSLRLLLVAKAKENLGVNYRYGHSEKDGFDCSGFVKYVYGQFNYNLPHSSSAQYAASKQVKAKRACPGDLVFFRINGKKISHVGIYLGDNMFIHSPSRGKQVCIESVDSAYYKKRLAGFGRIL